MFCSLHRFLFPSLSSCFLCPSPCAFDPFGRFHSATWRYSKTQPKALSIAHTSYTVYGIHAHVGACGVVMCVVVAHVGFAFVLYSTQLCTAHSQLSSLADTHKYERSHLRAAHSFTVRTPPPLSALPSFLATFLFRLTLSALFSQCRFRFPTRTRRPMTRSTSRHRSVQEQYQRRMYTLKVSRDGVVDRRCTV